MCFSKKEAKYATGRGRKSFSYQWEQLTLDPSEQSDRVVNKISTHVNIMSNVFLVLTQAFTKDKPSTILFYFHQSLVHNMFRLAPWSHGILLTTEWKIIYYKRRQLWGELSLSLTKSLLSITKGGGKGKQLSPLRGCLLSSLSSQVFPCFRRPQTLPCWVKKSSKPPTLD